MIPLPKMPRGERIRHIPGYPGYAVTSKGRVFSCRRTQGNWRLIRQHLNQEHGHYRVSLSRGTKASVNHRYVHQLVLHAFKGPAPAGFVARHKNGIAIDNRLGNLIWGTVQDNVQDSLKQGTHVCLRRDKPPAAKLSWSDVNSIRSKYAAGGRSLGNLANEYGVTRPCVGYIVNRRTWR